MSKEEPTERFTYYEKFHLHEYVHHKDDHYLKTEIDSFNDIFEQDIKNINDGLILLQNEMTQHENVQGDIQSDLNYVSGKADNLQADLTTLEEEVNDLESDLIAAEASIATLDSEVKTIRSDVTNIATIESDVNDLKSEMTSAEIAIVNLGAVKLDTATFLISNSLPGIPVLDDISIALIPSLTTIDADSNDKVSSWYDPVNQVYYLQTDDSKKPLLKRDPIRRLFYISFDGSDDFLINSSFDVSDVAGDTGNTCTIIMVVNTKQTKDQSQFQWGKGGQRFGCHLPWSDGNVYIDFGDINGGRLKVTSLSDLNKGIQVWTIRVNGSSMQLFRGVNSIVEVDSVSISKTLGGNPQEFTIGCMTESDSSQANFCEMDLYGLAVWSKSLSDNELKNMFRFIDNYYNITIPIIDSE